jgi:hypothetical protein
VSAFDPSAIIAADAALAQSALAAIDLGIQIDLLQSQLAVGDLVTATILPPAGGSDRLALFGQTVLAQLPPGIDPGETLLLQVTGFSGNQILVRNLGVVDPNNPPRVVTVTLPQPPGGAQRATLTTLVTRPSAPGTAAANAQPPGQPAPARAAPASAPSQGVSAAAVSEGAARAPGEPSGDAALPSAAPAPSAAPVASAAPAASAAQAPGAPPRAVFVAASIRPSASRPVPPAPVLARAAPSAERELTSQLGLEARLAAARATGIPPAPGSLRQGAPRIEPAPAAPAQAARSNDPPALAQTPEAESPPATPEAALLQRLGIPVLPLTLAGAKVMGNAVAMLPRVLARLDAVLARQGTSDARVLTLRTVLGFVQRIEPGGTRVLAEQIAAFVSHVIDGGEAKLASIARALATALAPEETEAPAPTAAWAARQAQAEEVTQALGEALPAPAGPAPADTAPRADWALPPESAATAQAAQAGARMVSPAVSAHIAERALALRYDAKALVVSLLESPPHDASAQLAPALNEALTTITGLQLGAISAQHVDPSTITLTLPVFYYEQGRPVQLHISRKAPDGRRRLDADNFHIAFVLDTKSLGTVAVEMQTAGRSVSVNVKTEGAAAADRFRSTLSDLRARLEQLRYRVASIAANVAPRGRATTGERSAPAGGANPGKRAQKASRLDVQA